VATKETNHPAGQQGAPGAPGSIFGNRVAGGGRRRAPGGRHPGVADRAVISAPVAAAREVLCAHTMADGPRHDTWVKLLREAPALVLELLRRSRVPGVEIPEEVEATVVGSEVIKARPDSLRADLVLRLGEPSEPAWLALVVEVQLRTKEDKRLKWPVYVAGVRAELACPVVLVVVAPRASVARWARARIELGHPGFALQPIVLGPDGIPVIDDAEEARRNVRLAILSAMAHGRGARGYDVGLAALRAVAQLDESGRGDYHTYVLDALADAVVKKLEEEMEQGRHRELTSLERHFISKGEARGRAEGEAKGRAEATRQNILRVLAVRGLEVPHAVRQRILGCDDVEQLDAWLARAVTVERADDVTG